MSKLGYELKRMKTVDANIIMERYIYPLERDVKFGLEKDTEGWKKGMEAISKVKEMLPALILSAEDGILEDAIGGLVDGIASIIAKYETVYDYQVEFEASPNRFNIYLSAASAISASNKFRKMRTECRVVNVVKLN